MKKFALSGMAYAGVTTLAKNLSAHGWTHLNYSDMLKWYAAEFIGPHMGYTPSHMFERFIENKAYYRPFLQELGTVLGFDNGFGLDRLLDEWRHTGEDEPVVVEKLRTNAQADILRKAGFYIVEIRVSRDTQYARARALGVDIETLKKHLEHPIEKMGNVTPDFSVLGDRSPEEMCQLFIHLAEQKEAA